MLLAAYWLGANYGKAELESMDGAILRQMRLPGCRCSRAGTLPAVTGPQLGTASHLHASHGGWPNDDLVVLLSIRNQLRRKTHTKGQM
jgi:hypothetical protein